MVENRAWKCYNQINWDLGGDWLKKEYALDIIMRVYVFAICAILGMGGIK